MWTSWSPSPPAWRHRDGARSHQRSGNRVGQHQRRMKSRAFLVIAAFIGAVVPALAAEISHSERKSGYDFMGRETRAMQDDDTANPGMLWVLDGEALWNRKDGPANVS